MVSALAPLARAASTKSKPRTWVVTLSETRQIGGMKTRVSDSKVFSVPAPMAPDSEIASSTEGKA